MKIVWKALFLDKKWVKGSKNQNTKENSSTLLGDKEEINDWSYSRPRLHYSLPLKTPNRLMVFLFKAWRIPSTHQEVITISQIYGNISNWNSHSAQLSKLNWSGTFCEGDQDTGHSRLAVVSSGVQVNSVHWLNSHQFYHSEGLRYIISSLPQKGLLFPFGSWLGRRPQNG